MKHRLAIALVVTLAACGSLEQGPLSGGSPLPPPTSSPANTPSAAPSLAISALQPVPGYPGVETRPIGTARGEHVFVTRTEPSSVPVTSAELWVIPLSNGADARALVRYPGHPTPALPSRLSPDGTQYAFELDRGDGVRRIAVANLVRGSVRWLVTDATNASDGQAAWSPTGDQIAFVRHDATTSAGVWVIDTDGSDLRRLISLSTGSPVYMHQWTPDGRYVAFYQGVGYDTVDVRTGARVHMDKIVSAAASWRVLSPQLVAQGYESVSGGDEQSIFLADDAAGTRKVLARGSSHSEFLSQPQWRPNRDEFLYAFSDSRTERRELRVRSLAGGERTLPISGGSATWTSDGSAIVYLRGEDVALPDSRGGAQRALVMAEVRAIEADGSGDRLLYRSEATDGQLPPNWCVCNEAIATRRL